MKKRFIICCLIVAFVLVFAAFSTVLANESTGVIGDLNCDGVLNSKDYSILSSYIRNGNGDYEFSDLDFNGDGTVDDSDKTDMKAQIVENFDNNGDGKINATDYNLLEMYLVKIDVSKLDDFNLFKCDYNGDGKVNFFDLNQLGYYEIFEQFSPAY